MSITTMQRPPLDWRGRLRVALATRWAAILVSLIIAAPLFAIAAPRLMAEIYLVPARITLEELRQGAPVSDAVLEEAARSLGGACASRPATDGCTRTAPGCCCCRPSARALRAQRGALFLSRRRQELESGLSRDPANGFGWVRLAMAQLAVVGK